MTTIDTLRINPILYELFTQLGTAEYAQLEDNLRAEGCNEPLVVWEETGELLDGHNRYRICQAYAIPFTTRAVSLPDLPAAQAWMIRHQLGRRNPTPEQMAYYRGKQYQLEKQAHGGQVPGSSGKTYHSKTEEKLAHEHEVSPKTIRNDATFAAAVDTVAAVVPEARQAILARDTKVSRQEVKGLGVLAKANPQTAKHVLEKIAATTGTPAAVRRETRQIVREAVAELPRVEKPAPVPLILRAQESVAKEGLEELLTPDGRTMYILHKPTSRPVFNQTNEMVDWASWTWNPVTGCWHGCEYCYARAIANDARMAQAYPKQFEPTFHPYRLTAPANTTYPKEMTRPADKNVFTCSMADLFGKWVPDDWIMQVFAVVQAHQEWNFLFLTKFPQRLQEVCDALDGFPDNAWVGCTVDAQARVATAERSFQHIRAKVRWLSVEPMRERLTFARLDMFDWVVMGGQTASGFNKTPAFQPEWEWVEHLWRQARAAGASVYWKENLTIRPKETPWE